MPNKKQHAGLDMNGYKVTGLPAPSAATDAVTKEWVEQNAGGSPQASNVTFTPEANTFPAGTDNVDEALKHLFTYANSGKSAIAGAIGSPTTSANTFTEMRDAINAEKADIATLINNAEGTAASTDPLASLANKLAEVRVLKKVPKISKVAGSTTVLNLKSYNGARPTLANLCVTPYIRVDDTSTTQLFADFNNGYPNDFFQNDYINFDGTTAKTKTAYVNTLINTSTNGVKQATIDLTQFQTFAVTSLSSTSISYRAIPLNQTLKANGDILLSNDVLDIESISMTINSGTPQTGVDYFALPWVAISFDSGNRYFTWFNNQWTQVNVDDVSDFFNKKSNFNNYNIERLEQLRYLTGNNPNTMRFAYLFVNTYESTIGTWLLSGIDSISLNVVMSGSFVPAMQAGATSNPPTTTYNESTGDLTITYNQSDAYIINYLDKP